MIGKCQCGACKYDFSKDKAAIAFVCYCSMCTDRTYSDPEIPGFTGQGWIAIPRFQYTEESREHVQTIRSSPFACRGRCKECDSPLTMQYDCEPNTTWVALDTVALPEERNSFFASLPVKAYIHVPPVEPGKPVQVAEDIVAYNSWEPWLEYQDPCRPAGQRAAKVCPECFLLEEPGEGERGCSCE